MRTRSECYLELKRPHVLLRKCLVRWGIFFFFFARMCIIFLGGWILGEKFPVCFVQYQEDNGGDWSTTKLNKYISGSYLKGLLLQLLVIYCFQNCKAQSMYYMCHISIYRSYDLNLCSCYERKLPPSLMETHTPWMILCICVILLDNKSSHWYSILWVKVDKNSVRSSQYFFPVLFKHICKVWSHMLLNIPFKS